MKPENKHGTHGWGMMACCAAMLLAVLALSTTGAGIGSYGYLLFLLCPVMHLLMFRRMPGPSGPRHVEAPPRRPVVADQKDPGQL
jgi:hypothetical protein